MNAIRRLRYKDIQSGQCQKEIKKALTEESCLVVDDVFTIVRSRILHQVGRDLLALDQSILKLYLRKVGNPTRGGYTPNGIEGVVGHYPSTSRHFFDFIPGTPTPPGEFEDLMGAAWKDLYQLGWTILESVNPLVAQISAKGEHHLRSAHYLNQKVDPTEILFPAHYDWSLLTLFISGPDAGLCIKRNKVWEKVDLPEGSLLVGSGTMLKQYDPGIAPLRHRVMAESVERLSLFFFMEPPKEVVLPSGETVGDMLKRLESKVRHEDKSPE